MTASSARPGAHIVVNGVHKSFGSGPFRRDVVRDCSFTINAGRLTVMIGPSGCGKSTLIRLIAGFDRPTGGTITMDGKPISGPGPDRLVVFQETALFPWMTTSANVMYGPSAQNLPASDVRKRADNLLQRVGLSIFRDKYPGQLSGGMQRRAELARAMVNSPAVMILDEPFRGLDAMTRVLMWEYCAGLFEERASTTLFVTTDIDEAIFMADTLLIMTNIPTRVRAVIDVDIPRPRRPQDIVENDRANDIKAQALALLHEEAMKSFAGGSRAAADFVDAYTKRFGRNRARP